MGATVLYITIAVAAVTAISLIGILTMAMNERRLERLLPYLVALAAGALLGGALFHLIPESLEELSTQGGLTAIGIGILSFFILERVLRWHHHHTTHQEPDCVDCEEHIRPYGPLILIADVLHNMLDGVVIAAAFLLSPATGIIATIAVALHEIPQEIGDFGVLLHAGFSKWRAIAANLLSGLSAFVGAGLTIIFADAVESLIPFLTALSAGGFLYIAIVDLVPELRNGTPNARTFGSRIFVLLLGLALIYAMTFIEVAH